jgi:hypothetical protein
MKEGALENPLHTVTAIDYDETQKAYHFTLDYTESCPVCVWDPESEEDIPESILLRAFSGSGYSAISWPPIGFLRNPTVEQQQSYVEFFPEFEGMEWEEPEMEDITLCNVTLNAPYNGQTFDDTVTTITFSWSVSDCPVIDTYKIYLNSPTPIAVTDLLSYNATDFFTGNNNWYIKAISGTDEFVSGTGTFTVAEETLTCSTVGSTETLLCDPITNGGLYNTRVCKPDYTWGPWSTTCDLLICDEGYTEVGSSCYPTLLTQCVGTVMAAWVIVGETDDPDGYKNTGKHSYYSLTDDECWVLGSNTGDQSCDAACNTISLNCYDSSDAAYENWNDSDHDACMTLIGGEPVGINPAIYAPFWLDNGLVQNCTPRDETKNVVCGENPPVITGLTFRRICLCQQL